MTTEKPKPELTLSDGSIKVAIWKREGQNGSFYASTFSKTYRDEHGEYQNSQSFTGTELLKISQLAQQAYQQSREMRLKDHQALRQVPSRDDYDRGR